MAIAFIFLPLYGKLDGSYIYSVNLIAYTAKTTIILTIYWAVFISLAGLGIVQIIFTHVDKESWHSIATKFSIALEIVSISFFAAAKEPYVTALLFLLFVMKIFALLKQAKTK